MHRTTALASLLVLLATPLAAAAAAGKPAAPRATSHASKGSAVARLHALFDREWAWRLRNSPELASSVGVHDYDDRLSDVSPEALERQNRESEAFRAELHRIDRASLPAAEQVSYDIFDTQLRERIESYGFGEQDMPLNADSGFHTGFALLWQSMPFDSVKGYENYVARLRAFPRMMDQEIAWMREGLKRGMTPPRATMKGIETSIQPFLVDDPEKSALWVPFQKMPAKLPAAENARLQEAGRAAIREAVTPAYRKFYDFMMKEYVPGTRETLAATALPNGKAYYEFLIRQYTTEDLTAAQIHQIGLDEVKSIRAEMDALIQKVGFQGDFAAFLKFLRTDPRFYAKTPDELLMRASWIAKQMDGKLPSLFKTLPRQPYTVTPVPDYLAPKYTSGRYNGAPIDSTLPGQFWVNTYALDTRPLYQLESL